MKRRLIGWMCGGVWFFACADGSTLGAEGSGAAVSVDTATSLSSGPAPSTKGDDLDESTSGDIDDTDAGGTTGEPATSGDEGTDDVPPKSTFFAVTFNTGGQASGQASTAGDWYGNGLSWTEAVEQTRVWFAELQPEVVTFQEIFYSPDCLDIPVDQRVGYVCETWEEGDPTVAQVVLGEDYQIACHPRASDKCIAIKKSFGRIVGCDEDFCLEGLDGERIDGCGGRTRVGRGVVELVGGGTLTVVNVHGTSGISLDDQFCRVGQFDQIFVDLDGAPAANGPTNLVIGDFNTDPGRATSVDLSARRLRDHVDGSAFRFITEVGSNVTPTYAGLFNIDHQLSDVLEGSCFHPGISPGHPAVVDFPYFDHVPAVCEYALPDAALP